MDSNTLAKKAVLIQLKVSQWDGRKLDRTATKEVIRANRAVSDSGRFNKQLMPSNEALKAVHKKSSAIRSNFYDNTLPWKMDGTFLLASKNYMAFSKQFRSDQSAWLDLVQEFLDTYDYQQMIAKQELGDLYNETDYPDVKDLERRFHVGLKYQTVPSNDFRISINQNELADLKKQAEVEVKEATQEALDAVWHRLYERVSWMVDRLSDPDNKFRRSMFEGTEELCQTLKRLNFSDDDVLDNMINEVESKLANNDVEDVRTNINVRKSVASEAEDIMNKMGALMNPMGG